MPTIKKLNLTPAQVIALSNTRNNASTYHLFTPKQKFEVISKQHFRKYKHKIRHFHFKAIVSGASIHLFNGSGKIVGVYENDVKGIIKARIDSRKLFLSFPIEQRNGGYCFDYFKDDLVRIDLTLGFSF